MKMNSEKTEEQTAFLAKCGDNNALEFLIGNYKNRVRMAARKYFLMGADIEDIIQEGMIGLYKAVRDFNPDKAATFKAFADMCIKRQILTAVKTAARQKHTPLNTYISFSLPLDGDESDRVFIDGLARDEGSDPEIIYIGKEKDAEFAALISRELSDFEKTVLKHFLRGESYRQISESLNKPAKSIDNALQRMKRKLEKLI